MRQSAQTTKAVAMNLKHRPETSSRRLNIRLAKILPFEQQRLARCFRQRIGETIAKVQAGRMTALAEI
jgi:hypothetical protein